MGGTALEQIVKKANQANLARECGVSRNYVNLIVNRKRVPALPVAAQLARVLGVRLDELVKQFEWDRA
jgi:transcriptional regulator with XRE-family HTH domain